MQVVPFCCESSHGNLVEFLNMIILIIKDFVIFLLLLFLLIQQVDEIYTKALHPHGTLNRKNNHRSKPNLNKQQQQQLSSIADTGNVNWVHDKINNNIGIKSKTNHSQHQIGME